MAEDKSNAKFLKELNVKRSSIKGQITKFKNYLDNISQQSILTDIEVAELTLKIGKLETISTKFDEIQSEIEVRNSSNIDTELDERESIEQDIVTGIVTAKELINHHNNIHNESKRESLILNAQYCHDHQETNFKLPFLQINKYNGDMFRWLEFRDGFLSLIHNNQRISPIHKFHYLLSYLEGDAARTLSNLEVSSNNYAIAWNILCERYDNKRLLINHHLNSLFNIQSFIRESEKSLRYLVDHVTKNLRALCTLGQPTDKWDILIIFILTSKLDRTTLTKWEELRNTINDVPTLEQFYKFLIDRADVLESLNHNKFDNSIKSRPLSLDLPSISNRYSKHTNKYTKSFASQTVKKTNNKINNYACVICNKDHRIYDCPIFKSKSVAEKLNDVSKHKLCGNCLRRGHTTSNCRMGPCRECKGQHNTLLHNPINSVNIHSIESQTNSVVNFVKNNTNQVLLSTAIIEVSNPNTYKSERVRALLDCGSQSTFITKSLMERLSLKGNSIDEIKVIGIGNTTSNKIIESCVAKIQSTNKPYNILLSCYVLEELTGVLPKIPINTQSLNIPTNITLADPNFYQPAPIDVLIGADIFWDILENEQSSFGSNIPKLINTKFGWLVAGPTNYLSTQVLCNFAKTIDHMQDPIETAMTKFWTLEEIPQVTKMSSSEHFCEKHFITHTIRLPSGRFSVRIPFIDSPDCLGDSYNLAKKRFYNLEKRFKKNPILKSQYTQFMHEYANLGHLTESAVGVPNLSYFLCHHAVMKDSSESSKIRVVFDGSAPTSSGFSLNDIQAVGPNLQSSLFSILIRARQYKYILTGDIEKMYRQIEVQNEDRNFQLILWREEESQPIKTLKLGTVTYGTASASYLSTRCLKQVGDECDDKLIKTVIHEDFYVDDLITGSNDENELRYIQREVSSALKSACFHLRKYKSNLPGIFDDSNLNTQDNLIISESTSTLGLGWKPVSDNLFFPIDLQIQNKDITKRSILSDSFKIFDPLGVLSPCIIIPKMLLQKLWLLKLDWDQPVPEDVKKAWHVFADNLKYLSSLQIPRNVICDSPVVIEIHSFSDASQDAYGACIYVRSMDHNNTITTRLLCSKSKVCPLKPTTIPRLELCAALMAAKLTKVVLESIRYKPTLLVHWCDSSVVLAWLNTEPRKLKTFVSNRVSEILESTQAESWRHVPTADNPADLISRGVDPSQLGNLQLWWSGPAFLGRDKSCWPSLKAECKDIPEVKAHSVTISESIIQFEDYSNFIRLQRVFAYVKRFIHNTNKNKNKNKHSGILSANELNQSFLFLCTVAQQQSFSQEVNLLTKNKPLPSKSKLLPLSPFIDYQQGVMRVGGRIDASEFPYDKKHPILLDSSHHLTKLLFTYEHIHNLHAGPQLLLAIIRETVWPINGRQLARRTVYNCVRCRRFQGKTLQPKMGNLPPQRLTPAYPFLSVGIDMAGPFMILNRKGRGSKLLKCYLCLFVCLRYKCMHLEAVSGLSKDDFILTLRRFIARRGKPAEIFSDNGRNFVAAPKEIGTFLRQNNEPLSDFASKEGIDFKFIPSYSPHFGGIWEAGIKSAKHHIKRVMGNTYLTFEEISTLFAQVEAILNSRPICPLSSSPNDFLSLSPGHFLIGRTLTSIPTPGLNDCSSTQLSRYLRLEQIRQHFWRRWQREYISELQQRTKWKVNTASLDVGDLVLVQEDGIAPLHWRLGRVLRLFPGTDGIPRVADINTAKGCIRRPMIRLCPLPKLET